VGALSGSLVGRVVVLVVNGGSQPTGGSSPGTQGR
jgi:hypothetical protein